MKQSQQKTLARTLTLKCSLMTRYLTHDIGIAKKDLPRQDIMYHLLHQEDQQKALNPTEIILNMVLFVAAGSETTSIQLTAMTHLLCANPDAYKKVVEEVRGKCKTAADITLATVNDMPYMGACAQECLRLYPPGSIAGQRVVPPGGALINGHHIPAGYTVSVSPWVAARSPLNFTDPDEFRPERWFREGKYSEDKLNASQAFGYGPKSCLGQNLAQFEAGLIMTQLLFHFDMEFSQKPGHAEDNQKWFSTAEKSDLRVYQALLKPNLWINFKERDVK